MKTRRFFAGATLPQALMAAARYHGLSPEELAYRLRDKRHGFVTRTRRFIIEVEPASPARREAAAAVPPAPRPAPGAAPAKVPVAASERPAEARPRPEPAVQSEPAAARDGRPASASRPGASGHGEPFVAPDDESVLAASVAAGHLLTLARLDLAVRVDRQADRLLLALSGPDEALLRELGPEFLDDLEHLVPRAIRGLSGRMVRCKVEGAGLRSAREVELRALAERAATEAVAGGEAVLLAPLSAPDRRIVHLALADDPRVFTESEGFGAEKRIRVTPTATPNRG